MGFAVYEILFLYVVFSNKCIFLGGVYGSAQYVNLEIYENKTNHFKVFLSGSSICRTSDSYKSFTAYLFCLSLF